MPTYLNVLNNAILRANLPAAKGNPAAYGNSDAAWRDCHHVSGTDGNCVCGGGGQGSR